MMAVSSQKQMETVYLSASLFIHSSISVFTFVVIVQLLTCIRFFAHPWTAARQASPSFTISQSFLKLGAHWVDDPTISSSVAPFSSCPQSFPASGSFPVSLLFESVGQSTGDLASVLPMNIQDWFPLGLTGLISLQSKGEQFSDILFIQWC